MPAVSLVVCLREQRKLLERLLVQTEGCYDDLVVVHDGPDSQNIREVVEKVRGRFFERPATRQQEPHWAFAWGEATSDWILRLDADEFPSDAMKEWLFAFRKSGDASSDLSAYTCEWPVWDGHFSRRWPSGRLFLLRKSQVQFFGMPEQNSIPVGRTQCLNFPLRHEPPERRSHGVRNLVFREILPLAPSHRPVAARQADRSRLLARCMARPLGSDSPATAANRLVQSDAGRLPIPPRTMACGAAILPVGSFWGAVEPRNAVRGLLEGQRISGQASKITAVLGGHHKAEGRPPTVRGASPNSQTCQRFTLIYARVGGIYA